MPKKSHSVPAIGKRIQTLRKTLKLDIPEFAHRVGYHETYISGFERGAYKVSKLAVKRICSRLGVSRDWLTEGKGDMMDDSSTKLVQLIAASDLASKLKILSECVAALTADIKAQTIAG